MSGVLAVRILLSIDTSGGRGWSLVIRGQSHASCHWYLRWLENEWMNVVRVLSGGDANQGAEPRYLWTSHALPITDIHIVWLLLRVLSGGDANDGAEPRYSWTNHTLPVTDIHIGCGGCRARVATASRDKSVKVVAAFLNISQEL